MSDISANPEKFDAGPPINSTRFIEIKGINAVAATPSNKTFENIKQNINRGLTRLHYLPEFKKIKGNNKPIALVGGGPSLKDNLEELKKFKTIVACGSVHDYLIDNNIVPKYAVACDPDAIMANYFTKPDTEVNYLISSGCDPLVFDKLKNYSVTLWHCHSDDYNKEKLEELGEEYQAVGGGCTVGLRSLSISLVLGYSNIHFFGLDSCMGPNEEHHTYDFSDDDKESLGNILNIKIGTDVPREKIYKCAGYHIAQAANFRTFYATYNTMFKFQFHGEGLLPDLMAMYLEEAEKLKVKNV